MGGPLLGMEAADDPTRFAFAHDHAVVRGKSANAAAYALAAALTLVKAGKAEHAGGREKGPGAGPGERSDDDGSAVDPLDSLALHLRRKEAWEAMMPSVDDEVGLVSRMAQAGATGVATASDGSVTIGGKPLSDLANCGVLERLRGIAVYGQEL